MSWVKKNAHNDRGSGFLGFQTDKERKAKEDYLDRKADKARNKATKGQNKAFMKSIGQTGLEENQAFQSMKADALRTGPSTFANLQNQALAQQKDVQQENALQQAAGQQASAFGQAAAQGGVSRGAATRMAGKFGLGSMMARQQAQRDLNTGMTGVATADEQNRQTALSNVASMQQVAVDAAKERQRAFQAGLLESNATMAASRIKK